MYIFKNGIILFILFAFSDGSDFVLRRTEIPKQYSSYRPIPYCNPSEYFRYPTTAEEVQAIVQEAIKQELTVKAFGIRHSQTDIICTDGIPVEMINFKFFQLNEDLTATFGAGVTLREATTYLRENGRAFRTTPAFGNITLGGAIGTGAHGSSIKHTASISDQVIAVTIVDGLGNIRNISKPKDMHAFRVHLGLLGIITHVTVSTFPLFKTLAHNYVVNDEILTNGVAQRMARNTDQISLYWFPTYSQVVVANWTFVDVETPGFAKTNDHAPSTTDEFNDLVLKLLEEFTILTQSTCEPIKSHGFNLLNVLQKYSQSTLYLPVPGFVPIYEEMDMFRNPAVGYYDLMFAPTCIDGPNDSPLQCLWSHGNVESNLTILDNEISLKLSELPSFIKDVKNILNISPAVFPGQGILMRFSNSSSTYMSRAFGRETVYFEFYSFNRDNYTKDAAAGLAAYQAIVQTSVMKYKARVHFGKNGLVYHRKQIMDLTIDPVARRAFLEAMHKYDPNEVFMNDFGRRLKGESDVQNIPPNLPHCGLLDYCFCTKDSDCASYQICTHLKGYEKYPVCQTIGEVPIQFYPVANSRTTLSFLTSTLASLPSLLKAVALSSECSLDLDDITKIVGYTIAAVA